MSCEMWFRKWVFYASRELPREAKGLEHTNIAVAFIEAMVLVLVLLILEVQSDD